MPPTRRSRQRSPAPGQQSATDWPPEAAASLLSSWPGLTWERLRRGHLLLGTLVLLVTLGAATAGIIFAASPGSNDGGVTAGSQNGGQSSAPLVATQASTSTAVPSETPVTAPATPTPPSSTLTPAATEAAPTATPGLGMPAASAGFHDAWLVAEGQDCQATLGDYRPQALVENANLGLNTVRDAQTFAPARFSAATASTARSRAPRPASALSASPTASSSPAA